MTRLSPIPVPVTVPQAAETPPGLAVLWRGRWRILAIASLALLLGAVYAYRIAAPVYRTHATLMLQAQDPQVIDLGRVVPALGRDEPVLNTQAQVLRSRLLVGQLVERLALTADPEFNAALRPEPVFSPRRTARAWLESYGLLPPQPRSAPRPDAARDATINAVIRRLQIDVAPDSLVFSVSIGTRNAEKSARIVNTLAELYIDDQVAQKLAVTDRATEWLTERVMTLQRQLEEAEALARSARAARGLHSAADLAEMERRLAALRDMRDDRQPDDPRRAALEVDARVLEAQVQQASRDLVTVRQLEREAEAKRLLYESYLARLQETSLQPGAHEPDARILSPAVVPLWPAEPKPLLILVLALILGSGAGGLLVLAQEEWRERLRDAEEARALTGLPVLATVPETAGGRDPVDALTRQPDGPVSASVRDLRASLMLAVSDRPPQVVLLTGTRGDEGCSTLALMLAQTFSAWDRSVLLIEADTAGRALANRFGGPDRHGILSVLAGLTPFEDACWRLPGTEVDALAAEPVTANGADLFTTGRFARLIEGLRDRYDHILIDAPPVLESADARALAPTCDAVLYVVAARKTRRTLLRRGLGKLAAVGVPVAGLVLSRHRTRDAA
ncbi:polysaccharide biosynthesis tyrosine autokinase [Halovulum sp. GXIMD14794]